MEQQPPQLKTRAQGQELARMIEAGKVAPDKRAAAMAALEDLKGRLEAESSNIVTSPAPPVPEADARYTTRGRFGLEREALKRARQRVEERRPAPLPDSDEAMVELAKSKGVDMRRGAPLLKQISIAAAPNMPQQQREAAATAFKDQVLASIQSGEEFLKWDNELEDMLFRRKITEEDVRDGWEAEENLGKYRWTSLNAEGLEPGDIARMFDLPEILAAAGAIYLGPGKGKLGTIGRGTMGGTAGRALGDIIELGLWARRGKEMPTIEDLMRQQWSNAKIELAASILGVGAEGLLKYGGKVGQQFAANRGWLGRPITEAEDAAKVAEKINAVQDPKKGGEVAFSLGEATDDPNLLVSEKNNIRGASHATRDQEARRIQREGVAFREYVEAKFAGDPNLPAIRSEIVANANTTVKDGAAIHIAPINDRIHVFPGADPVNSAFEFTPTATSWDMALGARQTQARVARQADLGSEKLALSAAADAANGRGLHLNSSTAMHESEVKLWQQLEKEGYDVKWNVDPRDPTNFENGFLFLDGGKPVASVQAPESSLIKTLMSKETIQGEGGRFTTPWRNFVRNPTRAGLAQMSKESAQNPYVKETFADGMWGLYEKEVLRGKWSLKKHQQWMNENEDVLSHIFSPEEMLRIRDRRGAFRSHMNRMRERNAATRSIQAGVLRTDDAIALLKDNQKLVSHVQNLDPQKRRRFFKVLEATNPEHAASVKAFIREDIANDLRARFSGKATRLRATRMNQWLNKNELWFKDVFGKQYVDDLKVLNDALKISARRSGVPSIPTDANPTMLQALRVWFGPLAREQRFFTAARRLQLRAIGEAAIAVVTDPKKLRAMVEMRNLDPDAARTAQGFARLGLYEVLSGTRWSERDDQSDAEMFDTLNLFIEHARVLEENESE